MKSMTGFAQGRFHFKHFSLFISFKSYNNRYLEVSFKGSGISAAVEAMIRDMMKDKLQRGKVEVVFDLFHQGPGQWQVTLNTPLLEDILKRLAPLQEKYGRQGGLPLDALLKLPMVLRLDHDPERLGARDLAALRRVAARVFSAFLASRAQEGAGIQRDLLAGIALIEERIRVLRAGEKECERDAFENYRKKIAKFLKDLPVDEKRIVQEAAISADRSSIAEEANRLQTHARRLKRLLLDRGAATRGKEADFLSQEMLRETHTIAAKTGSLDIHQQILLIRREIEKIRQQVQNVE
ncbi:MAG: YicC family protein [Acidobacteria bacterium]|jgi:uncharacterized protein (TIGR00255 family)|nr:YicC family protein [Acidobacteriota bacterium]